jgi:hypothetical protein
MSRKRKQVPAEIVARLAKICAALPEAQQEQAWTGTRWVIRGKNFAHVVMIDEGWPPAYARAVKSAGPVAVLTFSSSLAEFEPRSFSEHPFFRPPWRRDVVGLVIDEDTDWKDVAKLIAASYRHLAPKKLAGAVES